MIISYLVVIGAVFFVILLSSFLLRHILWNLRGLFFVLNWLLWFIYNPLRFFWKNKGSHFPHRMFSFLLFTGIALLYWLVVHITSTPVRIITAIYFDILLYWSVMFDDSLQELFNPKLGSYRYQRGIKYFIHWFFALPWRLVLFLWHSIFILLNTFFMFGISVVFPTFTFYHGTKFIGASTKITQTGQWKVGGGAFAGSGIYFGIQRKVAEHYARSTTNYGEKTSIIVVRFSPFFTRNGATLPEKLRSFIGSNEGGKKLSQVLNFPWETIEHWRYDMGGWWEYCLLSKKPTNTNIMSWKIRPIIMLKANQQGKEIPSRVWGNMSHYATLPSAWLYGGISWGIILFLMGGMR